MQQFQDEAVIQHRSGQLLSNLPGDAKEERAPSDSLASLAVGLRLRGYLSDLDRSQLESLAPCGRQVFLVYCGRVLYPTDGTPFPLDHIAAPEVPGGDALFSHRYHGQRDSRGHAYKIQTAVINPDEPDRLLFGWFGPEPGPLESCPDDRYSEAVGRFRQVFAATAEPTARMRRLLDEPAPTLLLERQAGRVLACNATAADRTHRNDRALIGLPFARLRNLFSNPPTGHRMTMQHLSAADLELTVVTLSETCTSHRSYRRFATDFLLRPARRKLSRIITAAELLSSYSSDAVDEDVVGLARAIASEAHRLDDLISKQLALVDEIPAEGIRGGLARPIALAAERVSSLLEHPCEVDICDNCPDDSCRAEHRSLDRLADAVLGAHHAGAQRPSLTRVTFEPTGSAPDLVVRFETELSGRTISDGELPLEYARRLARRLGYREFTSQVIDDSRLRTEFTLTTKRSTETQ